MANANGDPGERRAVRDYAALRNVLTAERLSSYLRWSGDDLPAAFARGQADLRKARVRATRFGSRSEVHGKVVAELTLGFWRYLAASRYLTTLWTPALFQAFPAGPADKLQKQRQVDRYLKNLLIVRDRAAHHEPIHRRDLLRDLDAAVTVTSWVDANAGQWVADLSILDRVIDAKPIRRAS